MARNNLVSRVGVEIELTSICSVSCPGCPRTAHAPDDKIWGWVKQDMSMETLEHVILAFPSDHYNFNLCGCYGDAIFHKQFISCAKRLIENHYYVTLVTSAANRPESWWQEFFNLDLQKWSLVFSIDGIEENNHLYRRGARWSTIETALRLASVATVRSREWKHLVFPYNKHTVNIAKELASTYNFKFNPVESTRGDSLYFNETEEDKKLWF